MALITSLLISMVFGGKLIERLRRLQIGETVRDLGPTPLTLDLDPGSWCILLRDPAGNTLGLPVCPGNDEFPEIDAAPGRYVLEN